MFKQLEHLNCKWVRLCSWENNETVTHAIALGQAVYTFFSQLKRLIQDFW